MGKKDASGRDNSDVLVKVLQTRRTLQDWRCAGTGRHWAWRVPWFGQTIGQGYLKQERCPLNPGWVLTSPRMKGGLCSAHLWHQEGSCEPLAMLWKSLIGKAGEPLPQWLKVASRSLDWTRILDQPEAGKSLEPTSKSLQHSLSFAQTLNSQIPFPQQGSCLHCKKVYRDEYVCVCACVYIPGSQIDRHVSKGTNDTGKIRAVFVFDCLAPSDWQAENTQSITDCFSVKCCSSCVPGGPDGKESACNLGDPGSSLGSRRSPEKGKATHSTTLAWRIPWTGVTVHVVAKSWKRRSN